MSEEERDEPEDWEPTTCEDSGRPFMEAYVLIMFNIVVNFIM